MQKKMFGMTTCGLESRLQILGAARAEGALLSSEMRSCAAVEHQDISGSWASTSGQLQAFMTAVSSLAEKD